MPTPNILIASIDGLRATALGAYGNTAFATPALDELAADSFLLDACYAPAVELPEIYRAIWQSLHPLRPAATATNDESLPRILASRGYATTLVADERDLSSQLGADHFQENVQVAAMTGSDAAPERVGDLAETAMARLFAAACDTVTAAHRIAGTGIDSRSESAPRFVWLHSQGMYGPWDAPIDVQQSLLDEDDPPPLESCRPPDLNVSDAQDPDVVFQYSCAYAAQVMILDECWKALMAAVDSHGSRDEWLIVLMGTRGYPLGEHGRIGGVDPHLYAEQLHVPWLMRFPNRLGRLHRSSALVSHCDLLPTVVPWLGDADQPVRSTSDGASILPLVKSARAPWRDALLSVSRSSRAIRTASWCLRDDRPLPSVVEGPQAESFGGELYVRPDDRWEANDVAKLCPDVVEDLTRSTDTACQHLLRNKPVPVNFASGDSAIGQLGNDS